MTRRHPHTGQTECVQAQKPSEGQIIHARRFHSHSHSHSHSQTDRHHQHHHCFLLQPSSFFVVYNPLPAASYQSIWVICNGGPAWSERNRLLLIVDLSPTHPGRSEVRIVIRTMFFSSRYNVKGSAVLFAIFEGILPSLCLYLHAPLYSRSATATVVCACR